MNTKSTFCRIFNAFLQIHDDDTTDQNRQNSFGGVPNPFNITVDMTGSHVNHVWVYAKKKLQINQDGIKEKNIVQIKWYNSQCPGKQEAIQNVTIIIQVSKTNE